MIDPKSVMYDEGRRNALALQEQAAGMTGTEIIAQEENIPAWSATKDYSEWPAGAPVKDEGQDWLLLIPHHAAHYTGRPSGLRTLWGLTPAGQSRGYCPSASAACICWMSAAPIPYRMAVFMCSGTFMTGMNTRPLR